MHQLNESPTENAVLSVLTGTPVEDAARTARTSPARLAEAVARYRTAGRAALDARPDGWHQVNIQFAHYPTAAHAFRTHLLSPLSTAPIGTWWFVRKYPHWRLRVRPAPGATTAQTLTHIMQAIDRAVSSGAIEHGQLAVYEPETVAFGGPASMTIVHDLFHADSIGVLNHLHHATHHTPGTLDTKTASLLLSTLLLRSAGLEWGEQGDVWGQITVHRPLPEDVDPDRIDDMLPAMQRLLMTDPHPALTDGPLTPLRDWATALQHGGQTLADAARHGRLHLGLRGILARHILFHWNRMGFTTRQQAIWARAAQDAVLG
ncbi:hypothetical protein GCM10010129_76360 [Streptomyces fumigatiscleroticus]|nr:hypothetical protein GCM10010129_76360 [Streptomyces fumigatiscleroticus]